MSTTTLDPQNTEQENTITQSPDQTLRDRLENYYAQTADHTPTHEQLEVNRIKQFYGYIKTTEKSIFVLLSEYKKNEKLTKLTLEKLASKASEVLLTTEKYCHQLPDQSENLVTLAIGTLRTLILLLHKGDTSALTDSVDVQKEYIVDFIKLNYKNSESPYYELSNDMYDSFPDILERPEMMFKESTIKKEYMESELKTYTLHIADPILRAQKYIQIETIFTAVEKNILQLLQTPSQRTELLYILDPDFTIKNKIEGEEIGTIFDVELRRNEYISRLAEELLSKYCTILTQAVETESGHIIPDHADTNVLLHLDKIEQSSHHLTAQAAVCGKTLEGITNSHDEIQRGRAKITFSLK